MKFISVRRLAAFFKLELSSIDDELIDKIRNLVNQYFLTNDLLNAFGKDFKLEELVFILDQLKEEKVRVFYGWIEQDPVLSAYLFSDGEKLLLHEEIILPKEHQLFGAYQFFVSNYLAPIMAAKTNAAIKERDLSTLGNHLRLSPLLPREKRIEIQQASSSYLRQILAQLKVSQGVDLSNQLLIIFSYEFAQVLNELDENFYSDSIAFIDTAKLVVQKNQLSSLVLDKIKFAILSLKLNQKHHEQVLTFSNSEAFTAQRNKPKSTLNNFVRSPLFFVALIAIVINFIFFYPLESATKANQLIKETSGIDGLSAEELNEVDTLLGFKQDSSLLDSEKLPNAIPPKYILTAQWEEIENRIARDIYSSMIADFEIQRDRGVLYNCADTKKERYGKPLYTNVETFSSFSAKNQKISNKSEVEVYILLFNPEKDGKVYGELIAAGRSTKVNLKKGDQLIFYSGKQMNSFNAMRRENNGYGNTDDAKKVAKLFDYHFCGQNVYNFQQLNKIYKVEKAGDVVFDEVGNGFGVEGVVVLG